MFEAKKAVDFQRVLAKIAKWKCILHLLLLLLTAICLLNFYSSWESQDLKTVYCRVRQLKYRADGKNFSC